jgi:hypothetical protein
MDERAKRNRLENLREINFKQKGRKIDRPTPR